MDAYFKKALALWIAWCEAKKIRHGKKVDALPTQLLFCNCPYPSLDWDESISDPDEHEPEYCFVCGHHTNWNRIKNGVDAHGWHREYHDQTGEVRFRNERESLLLTELEHTSRIRCQDGRLTDEEIRLACKEITKQFDFPMISTIIDRRFGMTSKILRDPPVGKWQAQGPIRGTLFGKGGKKIYF